MLKQLDLNGTWRVRWTDGQRGRTEFANREETDEARYIDAQVPGEIHLDVWKQGWIKDPFMTKPTASPRALGGASASGVIGASSTRRARRSRDLGPRSISRDSTWSPQSFSMAEIGKHGNSFHPCRIEVTGKLEAGRNLLTVHLDGGLFHAADKPVEGWSIQEDAKLHKRHWLRKPQCQFSWDWSTRLINVGITKPVQLEWTVDPARIDAFCSRLADLSSDLVTGTVRGRLFVEGVADKPCRGKLTLEIPEAGRKTNRGMWN